MISTVSLLNELLPMPTTQRCLVLCFTILYLSTAEFPTRFSFFLNKHLNCLWFIYPNFERYLFPAESSLTLEIRCEIKPFSYLILWIPFSMKDPNRMCDRSSGNERRRKCSNHVVWQRTYREMSTSSVHVKLASVRAHYTAIVLTMCPLHLLAYLRKTWSVCELWQSKGCEGVGQSAV